MPQAQANAEQGLLDYVAAIWRRKWTVLLTAVLAVAVAVSLDVTKTKQYTSTTSLLLTVPGTSQSASAPTSNTNTQPNVPTDIELVQSAQVRGLVRKQLGSAPAVAVTQVGTTNVVAIAATSASPRAAAKLANTYANSYILVTKADYLGSVQGQVTQLQTQVNSLQTSINQLNGQLSGGSSSSTSNIEAQLTSLLGEQAALKTQLSELQQSTASASGGQIVNPATPSATPSSPKTVQDALFALGIGLLVGIGLALLRDFLDDRIRTREELELATGGMITIGLIPEVAEWRDRKASFLVSELRPKSPAAEAYRSLRTSIQFMGLEQPIKLLQVTSAAAADGKTTTSANLAVAMGQAGQRVALIACDLRKPRLHDFFGLSNDVGFTSVLLGQASLDQALQPVPDEENLTLLSSGPVPPNPSELLSGAQARALFHQLSERFDVVVIDSSPVLPVTDGSVLAALADAVLLVVAANISTRRDTMRGIELLSRVNANIVGTVLNRASEADSYVYYRYGYGYGYGYGGPAQAPSLEHENGASPAPTQAAESTNGDGNSRRGRQPRHAR